MISLTHEDELEDRIRREFRAAYDELEKASTEQKADATARLKRAMRRLYDIVGYGRVPADLQGRRTATSSS